MRAPVFAVLALAACAAAGPETPDLPLARAALASEAPPGAQGETRFAVRALIDGRAVAARCEARGQGFSAAFSAPAELAVPAFGAASAPVRVSCAADGRKGAQVAQPALRRIGGETGVYPAIGVGVSSGGGVGVSLGGWWGGIAPERTAYYATRYPDLAIELD